MATMISKYNLVGDQKVHFQKMDFYDCWNF
jgi:hypothetical protein